MALINISLKGDRAWIDWAKKKQNAIDPNKAIRIAPIKNGTQNGEYAVLIGAELEDGSVVILQTTRKLFCRAASVLKSLR